MFTNNQENVRLVKRYQNRKLYDTEQSRYVTLDEIAKLIQTGANIKVVDNKTSADITYHTYIQLLFELEKKADSPENVAMMVRIIKSQDGLISSYIKNLESRVSVGDHSSEERPRIHRPTWTETTLNQHQVSPSISIVESPSTLN